MYGTSKGERNEEVWKSRRTKRKDEERRGVESVGIS
jgi:hypothetical protein